MKVNKLKYLIFAFIILCASCRSNKSANTEAFSQTNVKVKPVVQTVSNHSSLTEKHIGSSFTIKGNLVETASSWILIENPTSRSKVTFTLDIPNELKPICAEKVNTFVTISGLLTEVKSPWNKSLSVKSIE